MESRLQSEIQRAVGCLPGVRIFRNSVGLAWSGKITRKTDQWIQLAYPRPVHFGLHVGSADLIGWRETKITPEMVGKTVAVFTSIEVKDVNGEATKAQINWALRVREAGGFSMVARDARAAVQDVMLWKPV